jgi:hypothetical protein
MLARFGDVLFWFFGGLGVLILVLFVTSYRGPNLDTDAVVFFGLPGGLLLLLGLACRYVLRGKVEG